MNGWNFSTVLRKENVQGGTEPSKMARYAWMSNDNEEFFSLFEGRTD
jgi:hypothetical protein